MIGCSTPRRSQSLVCRVIGRSSSLLHDGAPGARCNRDVEAGLFLDGGVAHQADMARSVVALDPEDPNIDAGGKNDLVADILRGGAGGAPRPIDAADALRARDGIGVGLRARGSAIAYDIDPPRRWPRRGDH